MVDINKSEFAEKVHGDYDVVISTGTNEILDLAKVDGLPPIIQQFHTDPNYPFRHWIKRWRRNRAIKFFSRVTQILRSRTEGALLSRSPRRRKALGW